LMRCWFFAYLRSPAFLREPFEGIELLPSCQRESGVTPLIRVPRNALRKISKNDQQKILVPLGRAKGLAFRVMQSMVLFGLSSAGFPTGGSGCNQRFHLYPNEPASHFPQRAGSTATGRLHCCLCNFSRVTHVTQVCKRRQTAPCSPLRLPDNNNPATKTQAKQSVETPTFLWERALLCGRVHFAVVSKKIPDGWAVTAHRASRGSSVSTGIFGKKNPHPPPASSTHNHQHPLPTPLSSRTK
jgi:hypothetical protein